MDAELEPAQTGTHSPLLDYVQAISTQRQECAEVSLSVAFCQHKHKCSFHEMALTRVYVHTCMNYFIHVCIYTGTEV